MQNYILQLNSAGVSEGCWSTIAKLVWSAPNIAKSQTVVQQCVSPFAMRPFTLKVLLFCLLLFITVYTSKRACVRACTWNTCIFPYRHDESSCREPVAHFTPTLSFHPVRSRSFSTTFTHSLLLGTDHTSGEQHNKAVVHDNGKTAAHLQSLWTVKLT